MSHTATDAHPGACDNCATPLHGAFCHVCGQHAHNPLRSLGHAIEDVFESFWHLDGRVFLTLRDLLAPGRLATRFLAGHRMPYLPPLRLFVILSVLTFFIAQFAIHFGNVQAMDGLTRQQAQAALDGVDSAGDFAGDTTRAAVQARLTDELTQLQVARTRMPGVPLRRHLDVAEQLNYAEAEFRMKELDPHYVPGSLRVTLPPASTTEDLESSWRSGSFFDHQGKPWDRQTNPVVFDTMPAFFNAWFNRKLASAQSNLQRYGEDPDQLKQAMVGTIPTALFILVPVFALMLKLLYLGSGRLYLEHLVVALYSHAFLCLALLAIFSLMLLGDAVSAAAPWATAAIAVLRALVWLWMPVYLYRMQQRVYGERWWLTALKYAALGLAYFFLVGLATVGITIASVTAG
jgi:TM2 domain-containing membrane protein YozV